MRISLFKIYCFFFLLTFTNSMFPWYMWNGAIDLMVMMFMALISIVFFIQFRTSFSLTKDKLIQGSLIAVLFIQGSTRLSVFGNINMLMTFISVMVLLMFKEDIKIRLLDYLTKWFSILLLVSLIAYILFFLGMHISPSYIEYDDGRYPSLNYFFFILPQENLTDYFRFRSIFMEPGHMTMGVIPLIMANRFNLKNKYVLILFIVELFTFSLAGYITLAVGLLLFYHRKPKYLLLFASGILAVIGIVNALGYSDLLDTFLWSRLEVTDEGTIAGNNRVTSAFDAVFHQFMSSDKVLFGDPNIDLTVWGGISGYKVYLVQCGIIGMMFAILVYVYNFMLYKKKEIFYFTIILLLLLYQNSYPLWCAMIFTYIIGSSKLQTSNI